MMMMMMIQSVMGNGKILISSCFSMMQVILFSSTLFNIFMYCKVGKLFSLLLNKFVVRQLLISQFI